MNNHYNIMVIKKLIETTPKSLKLFGIGELTPYDESTLTPVSIAFKGYNSE
jgi:hypothetical protein